MVLRRGRSAISCPWFGVPPVKKCMILGTVPILVSVPVSVPCLVPGKRALTVPVFGSGSVVAPSCH